VLVSVGVERRSRAQLVGPASNNAPAVTSGWCRSNLRTSGGGWRCRAMVRHPDTAVDGDMSSSPWSWKPLDGTGRSAASARGLWRRHPIRSVANVLVGLRSGSEPQFTTCHLPNETMSSSKNIRSKTVAIFLMTT
jgi:hypothetical protein